MDYLKNHPSHPNIEKCMTALSDHLRSGIFDHSIIDNWSVRGAKISILRATGRELSLKREEVQRWPTPYSFTKYIHNTYMSSPLDWESCDNFMTGLGNLLCYQFGLRVSECCYHTAPDRNHAIMANDVTFYTLEHPGISQPLHPWELQPGNHFHTCPSHERGTTSAMYDVVLVGENSGIYQNTTAHESVGITVSSRNEGVQLLLSHPARHRDEISSTSITLIRILL